MFIIITIKMKLILYAIHQDSVASSGWSRRNFWNFKVTKRCSVYFEQVDSEAQQLAEALTSALPRWISGGKLRFKTMLFRELS